MLDTSRGVSPVPIRGDYGCWSQRLTGVHQLTHPVRSVPEEQNLGTGALSTQQYL